MSFSQKIRSLFDDYSEQRFVVTIVSGAGTWLLAWFGKIGGETYGVVTSATVGAFIAAAVYEKVQAMKEGQVPPPG